MRHTVEIDEMECVGVDVSTDSVVVAAVVNMSVNDDQVDVLVHSAVAVAARPFVVVVDNIVDDDHQHHHHHHRQHPVVSTTLSFSMHLLHYYYYYYYYYYSPQM